MKKIQIINSGEHYKDWLGEDFIKEIESTTGLIIFTGGPDVPPWLYGEKNVASHVNNERTLSEIKIYKEAVIDKIPVLGICYGSQLVTALQPNGKVIQDVTNHAIFGTHSIRVKGLKKDLEITSTHHQMMYPFNIENYEIMAYSTNRLSRYYLGVEKYTFPILEPEIVYYPNTNTLAIQGHPESGNCPEETKEFCRQLIKKYLLKITT